MACSREEILQFHLEGTLAFRGAQNLAGSLQVAPESPVGEEAFRVRPSLVVGILAWVACLSVVSISCLSQNTSSISYPEALRLPYPALGESPAACHSVEGRERCPEHQN